MILLLARLVLLCEPVPSVLPEVVVGVEDPDVEHGRDPRATISPTLTFANTVGSAGVAHLLRQLVPLADAFPCLWTQHFLVEVEAILDHHGAEFLVAEQEDVTVVLGHIALVTVVEVPSPVVSRHPQNGASFGLLGAPSGSAPQVG